MGRNQYYRKITVYCRKCKAWVDEKKVESLDIEEDIQGADILTFKCTCGEVSKSRRYG